MPILRSHPLPDECWIWGAPALGITVARGWLWNMEKKNGYSSYSSWVADAKGSFRVPGEGIGNWPLLYPLSLFATDAEGNAMLQPWEGSQAIL